MKKAYASTPYSRFTNGLVWGIEGTSPADADSDGLIYADEWVQFRGPLRSATTAPAVTVQPEPANQHPPVLSGSHPRNLDSARYHDCCCAGLEKKS